MDISITNDNVLCFQLRFDYKIKDVIVFQSGVVVILFDIPEGEPNFGRNVIAVDILGNEIWRIESDALNNCFRYTNISKNGNNLIANNFSTNQLIINPETGKVMERKWVK